ncbi:MAG: MoxR family ATPase [Thiotrichales bacterium]|nr:MoxR family ATPase [Thiotrichales bacterium]
MDEFETWRDRALRLEAGANRIMAGQERAVRLLLIATLARGHALLEGDVGVGKTTLLQTLARGIGGAFERIEGTVDLMPSDLVYYTWVTRDGQPRVDAGPLLRHGPELSIFFFNEINRARPQVHSLMLRAMAERSVNAFNAEHRFPHLQVFADRNRVEREETFEIPAAVRDRFFMEIAIEMPDDPALQRALMTDTRYHSVDALIGEMEPGIVPFHDLNDVAARIQSSVDASETLLRYALDLCAATRRPAEFGVELDGVDTSRLVQAGTSPRGMSMLLRAARVAAWLAGRSEVLPGDLHAVFEPVVAHRIFFSPIYEMRRSEIAAPLVTKILATVASP